MFLGQMGLRRLWYRALCGMCDRKRYWNTYKSTLEKVGDDMKKQMDIVKLIRRLRAHGFALSMLFEKNTLSLISKKSKGKPFEEEQEPVEEVSSDNNMWGSHEMFTKKEKEEIVKKEMQQALKEKMGGKNAGSGLTLGDANSKAMRQLGAAAGTGKVTESGGTVGSNINDTSR